MSLLNEPKFKMPLARSLEASDASKAKMGTVVSPLVFERRQREIARKLAQNSSDPLTAVRFRSDTFSAHIEGFMRNTTYSELTRAAADHSKPHVAAACQGVLNRAGQAPEHAQQVHAVAASMREAFAEGVKAIERIHTRWGEEAIDTPAARDAVAAIVERLHHVAQTAITFLRDVGDRDGIKLGQDARQHWTMLTHTAEQAVNNFDRYTEQMERRAKHPSGPRM